MAKRINFNDYLYLEGDNVEITGTGGLRLPTGTTAQAPSITQGVIRYNIETDEFEMGLASNQVVSLSNRPGSGVYYSNLGGVLNGSLVIKDYRILNAEGSALQPSYSFYSDDDTGFYQTGPNNLSISVGGTVNATPAITITNTGTGNYDKDIVINGNLTVKGTQTTVNSTTLAVEDNSITLNKGGTNTGKSGIDIEANGSTYTSLEFDFANDYWDLNNKIITNSPLPSNDTDLSNKKYVDDSISTETTRATGAETTLQNNITNETSRATAAESALSTSISSETTRAENAENTITTNLNSEVSRATSAETTLQNNIDAETTRATTAEGTLTTNLNNEISRATTAEGTISTNLTTETNRAKGAETTLQNNIDAETTRATTAEGNLETALNNEISRATAAENTLQTNIDAETTRATNEENNLQSQINNKQDTLTFTPENVANKGQPSGYASLDSSGKIPTSEMPSVAFGGLDYLGTWDAINNNPTITSGQGSTGQYYKVSSANTNTTNNTTIDGINNWGVGDWIIFNGSTWQKIDQSELVTSVNGKIGAVNITLSDVGATTFGANLATATDANTAKTILTLGTAANYNVGSGNGLDADTVDGFNTSQTTTASTIVVRDTNGDIAGNILGNAATASKWQNSITMTFAQDLSGSVTFDGSANVTANVTVVGLQSSLTTLQNNIDAETTRAEAAESTLTTNLNNEISRAEAAESTLTTNLNNEISRAEAAEATKVSKSGDTMTGPLTVNDVVTANSVTINNTPVNATDAITKQYLQDSSFLNFDPKVGLTSTDQKVNFSAKINNSFLNADPACTVINEFDDEVMYFTAFDGVQQQQLYRASNRASKTFAAPSYTFDNDPVRPPFLGSTQYITKVYSATENWMIVDILDTNTSSTVKYIIHTNNNNDYSTWTSYTDITNVSLTGSYVYYSQANDTLINCYDSSNVIVMDIFNATNGTKVNSTPVQLIDLTNDIDFTNTQGYTHVAGNNFNIYSISILYIDNFSNLIVKINGYESFTNGSGTSQLVDALITVSYNVPASYLTNLTGSITNLIPFNSTTYNYFTGTQIKDTGSYFIETMYYNPFYSKVYLTSLDLWQSSTINHIIVDNITSQLTDASVLYQSTTDSQNLPDSSPWSKQVDGSIVLLNDNVMVFHGVSASYGSQYIMANYTYNSTSGYLEVDAGKWRLLGTKPVNAPAYVQDQAVTNSSYLSLFESVSYYYTGLNASGTQQTYICSGPSQPIYSVVSDPVNLTLDLTDTGKVFPAIDTASGYSMQGAAWAYDWVNGLFYTVVTKTGEYGSLRLACYDESTSTWNYSSFIYTAQADASRNSYYGTTTNVDAHFYDVPRNFTIDSSGNVYNFTTFTSVGGAFSAPIMQANYNKSTSTFTVNYSSFTINPYNNVIFSNNNKDGYTVKYNYEGSIYAVDLYNTTTPSNFLSVSTSNYKFAVQGSTGLLVNINEQDIFLGGYYSKLTPQSITLPANSTVYLYVYRDSPNNLKILTSTENKANTFSKVNIGSVTTNASDPVSQTSNNIEFSYSMTEIDNFLTAKLNKAGDTMTGSLSLGGNQLQNYVEEFSSPTISSGVLTIDCSVSNLAAVTLNQNVTTLSFSSVPTGGVYSLTMELTQDATGSRTITWPSSIKWNNGTAVQLSTAANAVDVLSLYTRDGGTTWYAFVAGKGMA